MLKINFSKNFNSNNSALRKILINVLGNLIFSYCLIVAVVLIMFSFVTIECDVNGTSMQPTLNVKGGEKSDIVFINKYDLDFDYGDIVVIRTDNEPIIKRVLGLSGDIIDIVLYDNVYYLERNGEIIEESYIKYNSSITIPTYVQNGMDKTYLNWCELKESKPELFNEDGKMLVCENQIFVLGDNRAVSLDSSSHGTYAIDKVDGIVEKTLYYGESEFEFYWNYIVKGEFFYTIINIF